MKHLVLVLFVLFFSAKALDVNAQKTRILFVFDASNSMNGYWGGERKINTAVDLLSQSLEELYGIEDLELGLRVYGHQTVHVPGQQDCDDTELVVPIGSGNNLVIKKELSYIRPKGTTPIARSLEKAAGDFTDCDDCRNIIILITDGIEACDEDPCAVSKALQAKGIIVKPFVIGIGLDAQYKSTFECVGNYFDATNAETFEYVLDIVITQALNNTSVQVNLLDAAGEPTETDVAFTLYDQDKGDVLYNFVHTLNNEGNPDTLSLDPLPTYELVVHTLPQITVNDLVVKPGVHTVFEADAAQGELALEYSGGRSEYENLQCVVTRPEDCSIVHHQTFGSSERYLVGTYDLEILTTPRMTLNDVAIKPNEKTRIVIPAPGILLLNTGTFGYGGIFLKKDNTLQQAVKFSFGDPTGRYVLQPGDYVLIFRSRNSNETLYSIEREFSIKSGSNTNLNLN
jgi:Ca-activated chloride channel family protein